MEIIEIDDLRDADPLALEAILRLMEQKVRPPRISTLDNAKTLMSEERRLEIAYQAGRASIVGDLRIALNSMHDEQDE
jgi:hypothetical protein